MKLPPPYAHLMALAPLDVWMRMLAGAGGVAPRYWLRLGVALGVSALATLVTLPERLLVRRRAQRRDAAPLFILGFYRSGTTHLHYLLARDPGLRAPHWCETLAPQGFRASWALLRLVLTPLMPLRRPIDGLPFGPDLPSEDDFALNNGALSSPIAGRAVLPQKYAFYRRFDDLEDLDERERGRWRETFLDFLDKIQRLAGGRRLLLKTPAHTARVAALLELFPQAKFIHISRSPAAVLRSNLALNDVLLRRYGLQDPPPGEVLADRIAEEYLRFESRYLASRAALAADQVVELRFEDLLADPLGELRRAYASLGLAWSEAFEEGVVAYLEAMRGYGGNVHDAALAPQVERVLPRVAELAAAFGHERPPIAPAEVRRAPPAHRRAGAWAAVITALGAAAAWLLGAAATGSRLTLLVLPAGFAIGFAARQAARGRSAELGWVAAAVVLALLLGVTWGATDAGWGAALAHLAGEARWLWAALGAVSAYKIAARV